MACCEAQPEVKAPREVKLWTQPQQSLFQKLRPQVKLPDEASFLSEFDPNAHPTLGTPTAEVVKLDVKEPKVAWMKLMTATTAGVDKSFDPSPACSCFTLG